MIIKANYHTGRQEPVVCFCAEETDLAPGASYGPVIRDIYIIECNTEGYGSVIINGVEHSVAPKSCYILLPGDTVIHKADSINPRRGIWCAIDGLAMGRHLKRAGVTSENPFLPTEAFEEFHTLMKLTNELWAKQPLDAGSSLKLTSYIYDFLSTLLRYKSRSVPSSDWTDRAIAIMEIHYSSDLNVADIAKEIGLERAYFSTLFKEKTGFSPHQYLTSLRIRKACELLENSTWKIADIAGMVGLDCRNFARLFKQETGKTPHAYKNEAIKKK